MMVVRIVACKRKTPLSWLIRKLCNSPYSHLGIMANNGKMIDADWGGVKVRPLYEDYDEFRIYMPESDWKLACNWLSGQRGKRYDFLGALGTAIYNALGWKRAKNLLNDVGKWTCSELVFEFCRHGGIILKKNVDGANFHPGHILSSKAVKG